MKMVSYWYDYTSHSSMVGALSLSYLFGDAFARLYLGIFVYFQFKWNVIMFISAATLTFFLIPSYLLLYPSPESIGEEAAKSNPDSVVKEDSNESIMAPLLKNAGFYIICLISAGFTFIRECLRDWVHVFLVDKAGVSKEIAPLLSTVFPLAGGISSLITGLTMDRFPKKKGVIMTIELLILCMGMVATSIIAYFMETFHVSIALILIFIISFSLTGPYALLQVFALDLGGKRAAGSVSSILDMYLVH